MPALVPPPRFRGLFRDDADARAVYSEAAGIGRIMPRAVAVPRDVDDLCVLVAWASDIGAALIPRGSGSSMPNGAIGDGVVVDLSRWNEIGPVDELARTIRVGPGALRADVDRVAGEHGLRFPVDPSSGAFCTIGGMASTNAAGAHSMRFGSTRRWVRALSCVFADGSRAEIRRGAPLPSGIPALERLGAITEQIAAEEARSPSTHPGVLKDSSGYDTVGFGRTRDLVDLLVGSEGTLAFFVGVELDLIGQAVATSSVLGGFHTLESAVDAAARARASGATACELLDRTFLDVAASSGAPRMLPEGTEAALLAEVEGVDAAAATAAAGAVEQIFRDAGVMTVHIALSHDSETELWELRHAASPILARLDPHLRSMQFIEDCAVPPQQLPAYVRGIRQILADNDTRGVIFGHAGDAHVHVNPLIEVNRPDWRMRVDAILNSVVALAASLGGTLTGEHGDGRLRAPLIDRMWSADAIHHFRAVKSAFDPDDLMNPGVKLPLAGERPIEQVKYDPALQPLPQRAAAALERVSRERAYSRFRLALLDDATV